jgi:hypothetical protein
MGKLKCLFLGHKWKKCTELLLPARVCTTCEKCQICFSEIGGLSSERWVNAKNTKEGALRIRIFCILSEWSKGCSDTPTNSTECNACTFGAIDAIIKATIKSKL